MPDDRDAYAYQQQVYLAVHAAESAMQTAWEQFLRERSQGDAHV